MLPSILMLRVGPGAGIPIPVPLFLLWPLVLVLALVGGLIWLVMPRTRRTGGLLEKLRLAWTLFNNLSGLKIDVRSADGTRVYFWII